MDAARESGALVVIMVDLDLPGIKIASETPTDMPWIGVNFATLEYFHLTKEEVSIPAESNRYEKYLTELVEDGKVRLWIVKPIISSHKDRYQSICLGYKD